MKYIMLFKGSWAIYHFPYKLCIIIGIHTGRINESHYISFYYDDNYLDPGLRFFNTKLAAKRLTEN